MVTCKVCDVDKDASEFDVYNKKTKARRSQCKQCRAEQANVWKSNNLDKVRANKKKWAANNRDKTKEYRKYYRKTKRGFVGNTFSNMMSRVQGKNKPWLYKGLPICERADFVKWTLEDRMFNMLFDEWERAGYDMKLTPSIDRLDSLHGYTFDNMGWITHSENSTRGCLSRWGYGS